MAASDTLIAVTSDARLVGELEGALEALGESAPVHRVVRERTQAIEAVRTRPPEVLLVEMGPDTSWLKAFVDDINAASPQTIVAAIFRPEAFGEDVSESAIIIEAMRSGVRDFLRRPISTTELRQLLDRSPTQVVHAPNANGKVVAFISNKGGVGKSTLSCNAAVGLAKRHPGRVLLIDASLQMGVAASMLDLKPPATLTDVARERGRLDQTMLRQLATQHESGLHLLAAPDDAVEAAEVDEEVISRVITLGQRAYDYVVVDTFPLFDRVVVAVLDLSDRSYLVMENVIPTLVGATKLISVLDSIGYPKERQRIILNRYASIAGSPKPVDVASRLGQAIDFVIPYDKKVIMAANAGEPYAMRSMRFGGFSRSLNALVEDIESLNVERPYPSASGNGQAHTAHRADETEVEQELSDAGGEL